MNKQRIAAYGGTFDPIHNGHIEIACAIIEHFGLDALLIIPGAAPPHKQVDSVSGSYHRYAMAAIATIDIPRVSVSTVELEHPDRPYTYETIETLSSFYGEQATLFFVMGSDSFEELHLWREPMRVLSKSNLIVAARPGYQMVNPSLLEIATGMGAGAGSSGEQTRDQTKQSPVRIVDLKEQPAAPISLGDDAKNNIYLTEYVKRDISSTDIRKRVSEGLSIADLVPAQVAAYIGKYGLYRKAK